MEATEFTRDGESHVSALVIVRWCGGGLSEYGYRALSRSVTMLDSSRDLFGAAIPRSQYGGRCDRY